MSKSLFSIVSENLQGALDNGKTPVGYTVKSYQGVLAALQKAKVVYNQVQSTRVSTSIGSRRYTLLKQTGLEGVDDGTGFIVHQNSNELSYQALCAVKEYMSFVVDYIVPNEENKKARSWVGVKDRPSIDSHALKGITLDSSGISFPPVEEDGNNTIIRMSQTLGGDSEPCKIGVGLSLNNLAYNFMKRFFPQLGLTEEQIESLASKGYLNAEVLIPKGKGESAFVLHARVTVKHEINDESAPFQVWIPVPIMLLNSFKELGTVTVEAGVGQQEKVGGTNVTFPFANSTYNHENAEISNFTPSSLKAFALSQDTPVQYVCSNLCNEGIVTQARVRLYFIESSKADIQKTIGKPIPEAYVKELFKGKVNVIKVESISPIGSFESVAASIIEFWAKFGSELQHQLSGDAVQRAVALVATLESGQDWAAWDTCRVGGGVPDGQGISAGYLQFTQKAGGLKDYANKYKAKQATDTTMPAMPDDMFRDLDASSGTTDYQRLLKWKDQFAKQAATDGGKVCQLQAWGGSGLGKIKRNATIKWYNSFGCTTPLQLMTVFGAINHIPTYLDGVPEAFPGCGFQNHLSTIRGITDPQRKALAIEAAHWIEYAKWQKLSDRNKTIDDIITNGTTGTHRTRFNRTKKYILSDIGGQCASSNI